MNEIFRDVTVILREAGERTADESFSLLASICPSAQIHRIRETPFSRAVEVAFEIGISENRPWTLCIDADVMIRANGLQELQAVAEVQDHRVFEIQGYVADKFFGHFRPAGNHLYRTNLLERALSHIPAEGTSLRPESTVISAMEVAGFPSIQLPTIVGIHDFEQFYIDIYRKCYLQSQKHDWLSDFLRSRWKRRSEQDEDYRVAILGFESGQSHDGTIRVDKRFQYEESVKHLKGMQIAEKSELNSSWTESQVNRILGEFLINGDAADVKQQAVLTNHYFAKPVFAPVVQTNTMNFAQRTWARIRKIRHRLRWKN